MERLPGPDLPTTPRIDEIDATSGWESPARRTATGSMPTCSESRRYPCGEASVNGSPSCL